MALTPSNMLPLGTIAPRFVLPDPQTDRRVSLDDIKGPQATVVLFICNHCPYVIHVAEGLAQLYQDYRDQGVSFVAINANDVAKYPDDSPDKMVAFSQKYDLGFPYLFDASQDVAKAYDAACTPDPYVFDAELKLYYRGQLDGARPGNEADVTCSDIRGALDKLLSGADAPTEQKPSMGCNIKWRS